MTPSPADAGPGVLEKNSRVSSGRRALFGLTVVVAAGCAGLGSWQLERLFDRRARNLAAVEQQRLPTVAIGRQPLTGLVTYRPVTASGIYDSDQDILLRGRLLRGTPGVQVVTPLRIPGQDTAVLVNRGFVPSPDAGAPAAKEYFREPGPISLTGIASAVPDDGDGQPLATPTGETWRRLDLTALRGRIPYPIAPFVVLARSDSGSVEHSIDGRRYPIRIEPPPLDDGPHFGYAVQWFLIGGAALGFGIIFVLGRAAPSNPK